MDTKVYSLIVLLQFMKLEDLDRIIYKSNCTDEVLQEIKAIAERGFNNSQCNCGLKADIEQILNLITKAESEG